MDNDNVKSHKSTEATRKKTENNINCDQVRFEKIELNSKLFFENLENCKWLSCKDVSSLFSISENAVRILVYKNQIQAYKFGRRLRFKYSDCVALLRKKGS